MSAKRSKKWYLGGVGLAVTAGATATVIVVTGFANASAHSTSSSAGGTAGTAETASASAWLNSSMVQNLAQGEGISNVGVLASAGIGANSSAVIVGSNNAGDSCWTVLFAMGAAGGPFRCGSQPGDDPGESADQQVLRVSCEASGSSGSTTPDSASCIGFANATIATVQVKLMNGSSASVPVTQGAFAFQADTPGTLPTAVVGESSSGQAVAQRDVVLGSAS